MSHQIYSIIWYYLSNLLVLAWGKLQVHMRLLKAACCKNKQIIDLVWTGSRVFLSNCFHKGFLPPDRHWSSGGFCYLVDNNL
jgi:hypothetical protein